MSSTWRFCMTLKKPIKFLYHSIPFCKLLYDFAPTRQVFVLLVLIPQRGTTRSWGAGARLDLGTTTHIRAVSRHHVEVVWRRARRHHGCCWSTSVMSSWGGWRRRATTMAASSGWGRMIFVCHCILCVVANFDSIFSCRSVK